MTHTPCIQTGHNTLSPRFENSTTNPETPFYRNPLSKAKAYSAGAEGNRRQGLQKGLATSRSNPGLFTHHFNTAANCNRLTSAHMTKWKKVPKGKF